jgi:hypothetical protein
MSLLNLNTQNNTSITDNHLAIILLNLFIFPIKLNILQLKIITINQIILQSDTTFLNLPFNPIKLYILQL